MKVVDGIRRALILYLLTARVLEFASSEIIAVSDIRNHLNLLIVRIFFNFSNVFIQSLGKTPKSAAVDAVNNLISSGVKTGKIKSDYKLLGHRQTWQTACPGNSLYTMIQSWPHWSQSE